jgi:hypothetical protein
MFWMVQRRPRRPFQGVGQVMSVNGGGYQWGYPNATYSSPYGIAWYASNIANYDSIGYFYRPTGAVSATSANNSTYRVAPNESGNTQVKIYNDAYYGSYVGCVPKGFLNGPYGNASSHKGASGVCT